METYSGAYGGSDNRGDRAKDALHDVSPLIRMKCPACRKPYSVELAQLQQVPNDPPRFECVGCQTPFAVLLPLPAGSLTADTFLIEAGVGGAPQTEPGAPMHIPKETRLPAAERRPVEQAPVEEQRNCPKCGTQNSRQAQDCKACGIVFERYRPGEGEKVAGEIQLAGSHELVAHWKDVLENYADEDLHEEFVSACLEAKCLPFASHKYARILSVTPEEEIAMKMRKRIVALATQKFEFRGTGLGWKFRVPRFNGMIILLGSMVTTIGLMLPNSRNLTGIGISMLALAFFVRFFLRRSE